MVSNPAVISDKSFVKHLLLIGTKVNKLINHTLSQGSYSSLHNDFQQYNNKNHQ